MNTETIQWILVAISFSAAMVATVAYIRQRRIAREQAQRVAAVEAAVVREDATTGALSKHQFEEALEDFCVQSDASGKPFCLTWLDVDHFRSANDAFGVDAGDKALAEIARRIRAVLPEGSQLARMGGNEFAMLVAHSLQEAMQLAATLQAEVSKPIELGKGSARLTCSIGIAVYPEHGIRRTLQEKALITMRSIKQQGGNGFAEYDPAAAERRKEAAKLLHDLRKAVENGEMELYYQPKEDAHSLQITAVESLIRWRHPELGMVSPDRFIPLAERYGVIQVIGRWVIEEAARQAKIWRDSGLRMRIAVNISGHQMRQDDFVDHIESVLIATQTPPSRFTCEITESIAMEDTAATMDAFDRMGKLGLHVSIDDFGTGHSSLATLKRIPAGELKIDKAFVNDLATSEQARHIASTIINMAHVLDLKVVAEGVETQQQRNILIEMGVDEMQGYLFSKPMSAADLAVWAAQDPDGDDRVFRPSLFQETDMGPFGQQ